MSTSVKPAAAVSCRSKSVNLFSENCKHNNTVQILCIGTDRSQQNSADQDQTASEEAV